MLKDSGSVVAEFYAQLFKIINLDTCLEFHNLNSYFETYFIQNFNALKYGLLIKI